MALAAFTGFSVVASWRLGLGDEAVGVGGLRPIVFFLNVVLVKGGFLKVS